MQQSFIQNRKHLKSFVTRVGIALGIASVIAMAPMSNAMAETFYSVHYKAGSKVGGVDAGTYYAGSLDRRMRFYCNNRGHRLVKLGDVIENFDSKRNLRQQVRNFTCVYK